MREEKVYYKIYDNEEKEYTYGSDAYNFFELEFNSIIDARSYGDGVFSDKTRYEVHKFTRVISSDCVNCDPPTEEDFKRRAELEKEKEEYFKRREDYINKSNPKSEEDKELLRMSFDLHESLKELEVDLKDNFADCINQFTTDTQEEINSLADLFETIENHTKKN